MSDQGQSDDGVYLVTGSLGCLGAWTLRHLVTEGRRCVSFDIGTDRHRLDLLLSTQDQEAISFEVGDLTDFDRVAEVIDRHGVNRIVHLAALQIPFCQADPVQGARVNVVGTTNVFEAARRADIGHLTYASSVAVYGPADAYPELDVGRALPHGTARRPHTLYGTHKVANEDMARVYLQDHGLSSIGLRPYTVYGPGRDQGLTSDPTKAMRAAVRGDGFHIGFSGPMQFHYASDTARQFIAAADQADDDSADCFDLGGPCVDVAEIVELITDLGSGIEITCDDRRLPFPPEFSSDGLKAAVPEVHETPLPDGVAETMELFARLDRAEPRS